MKKRKKNLCAVQHWIKVGRRPSHCVLMFIIADWCRRAAECWQHHNLLRNGKKNWFKISVLASWMANWPKYISFCVGCEQTKRIYFIFILVQIHTWDLVSMNHSPLRDRIISFNLSCTCPSFVFLFLSSLRIRSARTVEWAPTIEYRHTQNTFHVTFPVRMVGLSPSPSPRTITNY